MSCRTIQAQSKTLLPSRRDGISQKAVGDRSVRQQGPIPVTKRHIPPNLQEWVVARKRYRLTHAHVYMARQLGLNPAKLGKMANNGQQQWKSPLPEFIEHLYEKRFGTSKPDVVQSIEQVAEAIRQKKAARSTRGEAKPNNTESVTEQPAAPDPVTEGLQ